MLENESSLLMFICCINRYIRATTCSNSSWIRKGTRKKCTGKNCQFCHHLLQHVVCRVLECAQIIPNSVCLYVINIETLQMCCTSKLQFFVVSCVGDIGDILYIQLIFLLKLIIILHLVKVKSPSTNTVRSLLETVAQRGSPLTSCKYGFCFQCRVILICWNTVNDIFYVL